MTITPEERAKAVFEDYGDFGSQDLYDCLEKRIAAAIREAVEAERAECAKLCDERYGNPKQFDFDDDEARGAYHCAGAIRQRGAK